MYLVLRRLRLRHYLRHLYYLRFRSRQHFRGFPHRPSLRPFRDYRWSQSCR
jgi:hypothetical protein